MAEYNDRVLTARGSGINGSAEVKVDNSDIIAAVTGLRGEFASMISAFSRLQVVLDSGDLVGGMIDPLDTALGTRVSRNWRER